MKPKYWPLILLSPIVLVADILTKQLVLDRFHLGEQLPVIPQYFDLTYVRNYGAAFSLLASAPESFRVPFFMAVPLLAMLVILWMYKKLPDNSRWMSSALSMVLAGALGNLIDRFRLGYVVDFLLVHYKSDWYYPAFNVADMGISIGVVALLLESLMQPKPNNSSQKAS